MFLLFLVFLQNFENKCVFYLVVLYLMFIFAVQISVFSLFAAKNGVNK